MTDTTLRRTAVRLLSLTVILGSSVTPGMAGKSPEIPAFPGAEGFGARASGGRGGRVVEVTNLNDRGPGSFREAVRRDEPRIVVFRVSGTIPLESTVRIGSNVTIAGQTAPGDGICLKNYGLSLGRARNAVVRFLRCRPGDTEELQLDALSGRDGRDLIVDHCSVSWGIDECLSLYRNENITVQWCIVSESLFHSVHAKGNHGYGGIWGGNRATFHHNLLAHHSSRNPRVASSQENVDLRNNVIYNWGFNSLYGGEHSTVNVVGCYYKPGPATQPHTRSRILDGRGMGGRWYLTENFVAGDPAVSADNWTGGVHRGWAPPDEMRAMEPFPAPAVETQPAEEAYLLVLAHSGAILPQRDPHDTRIVEEVRTGTARFGGSWGDGQGIIDSQTAVGGWPELNSADPPADADRDGMPDDWETRRGFDPQNASDGSADQDGDGYTNVEEYLNATDPNQHVDYTDPVNNRHSLHPAAAAP